MQTHNNIYFYKVYIGSITHTPRPPYTHMLVHTCISSTRSKHTCGLYCKFKYAEKILVRFSGIGFIISFYHKFE